MNAVGRAFVAAAIALAAVVSVATARELRIGARAMADSDAALARHDARASLSFAHDAAEARAPGSSHDRAGFARLEAIARDAETRGDERTAVAAWSAMRAASSATSSPFASLSSTDSWRALADDGIARVGSRADSASAEVRPNESVIRASLARDEAPSPLGVALLAAGAVAFLAGALRLAFAARDLPSLRRERVAVVATAAGFVLYLVACLRA